MKTLKTVALFIISINLVACYGIQESIEHKVAFGRWVYNEMFCTEENRLKEHEETKEAKRYINSGQFLRDFQDEEYRKAKEAREQRALAKKRISR